MVKGSWHAALKSFQKALQLSPGNIYASYQIGAAQMVSVRNTIVVDQKLWPFVSLLRQSETSSLRLVTPMLYL